MQVSVWWLLVAFWVGALAGVLLSALLMMSRREDDRRERAERDTQLPKEPPVLR
jgi:hypothetical protein